MLRDAPWIGLLAAAASHLIHSSSWPRRADLDAMYAASTRHLDPPEPLSFVENVRRRSRRKAAPIDPRQLYDGRIACAREVPTREGDWHDLFNALCFATFPRAKLALHRRQFRILCERIPADARRLPAARTREQDTLTLFDEGGVVLAIASEAAEGIRALSSGIGADRLRSLEEAGLARRITFGHALYEDHAVGAADARGGLRAIILPRLPREESLLREAVDEALAREIDSPTAFLDPSEHVAILEHGDSEPALLLPIPGMSAGAQGRISGRIRD